MIASEPPYDLVALFSDLEMQKLFEVLLERGQEAGRQCTRGFRWRSLRDPRRDTVWRQPEQPLAPFLRMDCRFLVMWDRHGSGAEGQPSAQAEKEVVERLGNAGVPRENVLAVALDPELECLFSPVWPKVKSVVAKERGMVPPEDSQIFEEARRSVTGRIFAEELDGVLEKRPKELFEALVRLIHLRRAAPLYAKIAGQISLPAVKREVAAQRIATSVASWFPPASP
jgi:hypothetical protein